MTDTEPSPWDLLRAIQEVKELVLDVRTVQERVTQPRLEDHSKRIRLLELKFYGVLAGIVAAGGVIVTIVLKASG